MTEQQTPEAQTNQWFGKPINQYPETLLQTIKAVSARIGGSGDVIYETILAWVKAGSDRALTYEEVTQTEAQATIIGNAAYLVKNFERVENGWIAYKIFNSVFMKPDHWVIEAGQVLREDALDTNATEECSRGINIAESMEWIANFIEAMYQDEEGETVANVWKVFIPDTATIVIPNHTDGKIRANEIHLLEVIGQVYYDTEYDDDDDYEGDDY